MAKKLAKVKTKPTALSGEDYLNTIKDEQQRKDSFVILDMMKKATKEQPKIWGNSLIGFGYRIVTSPATGRSVEWFQIGFAPRKGNISIYMNTDVKSYGETLKKLGKHKTGVGCLYINKLADVDVKVLEEMIRTTAKNNK